MVASILIDLTAKLREDTLREDRTHRVDMIQLMMIGIMGNARRAAPLVISRLEYHPDLVSSQQYVSEAV